MQRRSMLRLLAASALCLAVGLPAGARAETAPASAPPRITGPFIHDNLAIYLVHGASAPGRVPLTLAEAMDKGSFDVRETGKVNELTIENRGDDEVFIQAGDIVKGGRQDRVLSVSLTVPPRSGVLPISAFCVESGRWSARGVEDAARFASAKEMIPSREAKLAMKAPARTAAAPVELGRDVDVGRSAETGSVSARVQSNRRQGLAAAPSTQGEVWAKVGEIQAGLSSNLKARVQSERSATSLQLALENDKLAEAQKRFVDALEPKGGEAEDVVGYVFAVNGRLNSADIYASNGLFRKLWPRLVKASATEAISATSGDKKSAPDLSEVAAFLANPPADQKPEERALVAGAKLEIRDAPRALDAVTRAASGMLLHRNVLAH